MENECIPGNPRATWPLHAPGVRPRPPGGAVLNKRSDRKPAHQAGKNRKAAKNADEAVRLQNGSNGNGTHAPTGTTLDPQTGLALQTLLLERSLVTQEQLDQAFATPLDNGSADLGDALLRMGFVDEQDLIDARAE